METVNSGANVVSDRKVVFLETWDVPWRISTATTRRGNFNSTEVKASIVQNGMKVLCMHMRRKESPEEEKEAQPRAFCIRSSRAASASYHNNKTQYNIPVPSYSTPGPILHITASEAHSEAHLGAHSGAHSWAHSGAPPGALLGELQRKPTHICRHVTQEFIG